MLWRMSDARLTLLSTILSFPDDERPSLERELVPLARAAALGDLAADVAHDVANPLFGVLGLVDLLLDDATPGTDDENRLQLVRQAALEMKATLGDLLDYARPVPSETARADLTAAVQAALRLVRHGVGKRVAIEERYPAEPQLVACPEALLLQAVLHLLFAARTDAEKLVLEVAGGRLTVLPGGRDSVGTVAAARIVADHGGTVELSDDLITLRLPPA
jgi:two-component system, NtrC family, sensor kinase